MSDERVKETSAFRRAMIRPELGAICGAVLVFIFFLFIARDTGMFSPDGIQNWTVVSAQFAILAVGAGLLMIAGEFDLSIGSMIGFSGIVIAILSVELGWPIWTAILAAFAVLLLVLCFAEAASHFDEPGSGYVYTREAFGAFVGFEVGWMTWLARVASVASLSNGFAQAMTFVWPGAGTGFTRVLMVALPLALLLDEAVRADVVFLGEDVAKAGGVFKATVGLYEQFGPLRVRDTPISENTIVGMGVGAAMTGLRPLARGRHAKRSGLLARLLDVQVAEHVRQRALRGCGQAGARRGRGHPVRSHGGRVSPPARGRSQSPARSGHPAPAP